MKEIIAYQCQACGSIHKKETKIWQCEDCGIDICDECAHSTWNNTYCLHCSDQRKNEEDE